MSKVGWLSSFLFQVFRVLSLSMSLILLSLRLKYWQTKLRSFTLFAKANLCMQGKLMYIFSIYVVSSTRLPLMPSITCTCLLKGWLLNKVKYGEAPPRGTIPYPFIYHFGRKGTPFIYLLLRKGTPSTYLL